MVNTLYEEKNWFKKQRKRQKQKPPKYGGMSILSCFVVADPGLQSDERGHCDLPWSLQGDWPSFPAHRDTDGKLFWNTARLHIL